LTSAIIVVQNEFPRIAAGLERRLLEIGLEATHEIAEGAAERSRVDTGAMQAGWHSEGFEVTDPVPYTGFNERGTSKMAAQPMLGPAMEAEAPMFEARLALALR
jgi:hypothetical protein